MYSQYHIGTSIFLPISANANDAYRDVRYEDVVWVEGCLGVF